jgi:phycoerythrin-associated linker protein
MANTLIASAITEASRLGIGSFENTAPVVLWHGDSDEKIETVIRAVYRQVLGNTYVMDNERLTVPESLLKSGTISVREFVCQVAKSYLYRSRFFDTCPRYRFTELNFKHLLGRAPNSYEEMISHGEILERDGFEAEIDSYIDSDEYQEAFGEYTVPYYRGYKSMTGMNLVGFTYMFQLLRGPSGSDKENVLGNPSRLTQSIITHTPKAVIPPSSGSTYGGLTDVNKLLAEVLKLNVQPTIIPEQSYQDYNAQSAAYQSLKHQCEEQAQLIETLEKQLGELRSLGTIGDTQLKSKWQPYSSSDIGSSWAASVQPSQVATSGQSESYEDLLRRCEAQENAIAALRQQIANLQPAATIGEARLNKWRKRTFF